MSNLIKGLLATLMAATLIGCAARSSGIAPSYHPPINSSKFSCAKLKGMYKEAQDAEIAVSKSQNRTALADTVTTFLFLVPVGSAVGADKEGLVAQAKGRRQAVQVALEEKGCSE